VEKTVETLGERLAAGARQLSRRYRPGGSRLELLRPLIQRNEARAARAGRFARREAVPGPSRRSAAEAGFPAPSDGFPAGTDGTALSPAAVPPAGAQALPAAPGPADAGEPVPATLRDQLRPALGPGVDLARVHTGDGSDAFARSLRADAVTVGRDIYFRSGSHPAPFAPDPGLLAHELAHVAAGEQPDAGQRRTRPDGAQDEEEQARTFEQRYNRPPVSPLAAQAHAAPVPPAGPAPAAPVLAAPVSAAAGPAGGGALVPMRAATDRPAPDPAPAGPDLDRLRQRLFRDLLAQIRVEFERGA
jgi:hypothetical protein